MIKVSFYYQSNLCCEISYISTTLLVRIITKKMISGLERQVSSKISKPKNDLRRLSSTSSIKHKFLDDIHAREKEIKRIEIKRQSNVGEIMTPLLILPDNAMSVTTRKSFIPKCDALAFSPTSNTLETQLRKIADSNIRALVPQLKTIETPNKTLFKPDSNEIDRRTSNFGEVKANLELSQDLVKKFEEVESRNTSSDRQFKPRHKKSISDTSIIVIEVKLV